MALVAIVLLIILFLIFAFGFAPHLAWSSGFKVPIVIYEFLSL
jgi:hypothetical protein